MRTQIRRPVGRRKRQYRDSKWAEVLARVDDGKRSCRQVARELGCSESAVYYWRHARVAIAEMEEAKRKASGTVHCTRCGFLGEEENPIGQSGLCLYCRLQQRGVNLLWWYSSGAAFEYLKNRRSGREDEKVCGEAEGLHV